MKADAALKSTLVYGPFSTTSAVPGGTEYDFATVSVFIDPSLTSWIAWNDTAAVSLANAGCGAYVGGAGGLLSWTRRVWR